MSNKIQNIKVCELHPGIYSCVNTSTVVDIQRIPHELLCLDDGQVQIWTVEGEPFIWTATNGSKINVLFTRLIIISGKFVAFLHERINTSNVIAELFYLVDENGDFFVDELGNYYELR